MCVLFAYYHLLFLEGQDPATFRMFSFISCSLSESEQEEVGLFVEKHLATFLSVIPSQFQTKPIDIIFNFLKEKIPYCDNSGYFSLKAQIHIFDKYSGCWLYSNPAEFDQNLKQLFFLGTYSEHNIKDIEIVLSLDSLFSTFGTLCFFCKKVFKGKGSQHKCPQKDSCFSCRRPFITEKTCSVISKYFCDSSLHPAVAETCKTCNVRILTRNCQKHHMSKVCRFGWLCTLCQKYTFKSKYLPNISAIKQQHVCGMISCNFCGVPHQKGKELHLCPILRPHPLGLGASCNLGFLSLEVVRNSKLFCKFCFENKNCKFCFNGKKSFVNICTVFEESKVKGFFDKYCFSEFEIASFQEAVYCFETNAELLNCSSKRTFFNQILKRSTLKEKFVNVSCPLGQFFNHILQLDLKNFTYIVYDQYLNTLEEILKFLLKHGFKPKVVCMPDLALIDIFELQVRFINLKNYIADDFSKIIQTQNVKEHFFPFAWNQPRMYNFVGKPPTLDDFYCFDDSEDDILRKKTFVGQLPSPWHFNVALKSYSEFKASLTCQLGLSFLKQAIKTQTLLKKFLCNNQAKNNSFIHPFNPPIFTRAAYAYQTLLTFCPDLSDLRIVKEPIKMSSSKSELEYCAFLRFLYPHETFQDAWSPFGQKKYRETFPDSFSPTLKTAFFFNGCLVHGHIETECLLNRKKEKTKNYFDVPFAQAYKNFQKKNEKLLKNHHEEVKKIEVQWECIWKLRRKTDPILQNFIANVFKDPPNYRLNVRASGKNHYEKTAHYFTQGIFLSSSPRRN